MFFKKFRWFLHFLIWVLELHNRTDTYTRYKKRFKVLLNLRQRSFFLDWTCFKIDLKYIPIFWIRENRINLRRGIVKCYINVKYYTLRRSGMAELGGHRGARPPTDFVESINLISNVHGGQIMPPYYYLPPQIFWPSTIPEDDSWFMIIHTVLRDHPYITSAHFWTFSDPPIHPTSA